MCRFGLCATVKIKIIKVIVSLFFVFSNGTWYEKSNLKCKRLPHTARRDITFVAVCCLYFKGAFVWSIYLVFLLRVADVECEPKEGCIFRLLMRALHALSHSPLICVRSIWLWSIWNACIMYKH